MRNIEFKSGNNETVRGVLYEPTTPRPHPAIIFAHGLLSTHDEFGDYPMKFCARGYLVLAIDFRGHGASDGLRGLISSARNVQDLRHALDFIRWLTEDRRVEWNTEYYALVESRLRKKSRREKDLFAGLR